MSREPNRRAQAPKPLVSVEEASILLGESRDSLYRSIKRGDLPLPVYRINGRIRIPRRAVLRLLDGLPPVGTEEPLTPETQGRQVDLQESHGRRPVSRSDCSREQTGTGAWSRRR
ncbi:MAG TPA: helix-turn-helix domain-containing protein [Acidimicrobiales bacterium]|nr:helix-turn-helix domain-containing protein [Acidimicrobiales bacterium]